MRTVTKSLRLIGIKTNLRVQHTFLYIFFYGGIVVCAHQKFSYLCSCSPLIFFSAAHFHLASLRHFSFSHRCYEIFVFFFQRNSSPMFLITHSSSFSVIHVSVDLKNNVVKDTTLLLFFLS